MDPSQLVKDFAEREVIAEDILTDKQLIVDYDRKRNTNREALSAIKKSLDKEPKLWVNMDTLFIRLPKDTVRSMIQRDQQNLDAEINRLRTKLTNRAHELEVRAGGDGAVTGAFQSLKGSKPQDLYGIGGMGKVSERVVEGG